MIHWVASRFSDAKTAHATLMAIAGLTGSVCCVGVIAIVIAIR